MGGRRRARTTEGRRSATELVVPELLIPTPPPARPLPAGDGENDVEMLQLAGLGVAMGNAGAKARAAADMVVGSNDKDGVAEAVRRFVLEPRGLGL